LLVDAASILYEKLRKISRIGKVIFNRRRVSEGDSIYGS
jgi:hypothetical protein